MLTYTISVSIRYTLLRYSLFLSEYLSNHSNHSTCPDTLPDTINTRPRRRPSVQLETDRPGIEASHTSTCIIILYEALRPLFVHMYMYMYICIYECIPYTV